VKDIIQQRLEAESASCNDPIRKALVDAERAYHAARVGDFQHSCELLGAIRSLPRSQFAPSVAIWTMLSEGIVGFFEDLDPNAYDRFRRAYALSVSIGDLSLQSLVSAWLAHIEFDRRNYAAMVLAANHCLATFSSGNTMAHSRLFMVLANANLYAGNISKANTHYERSRVVALSDGDRATIGAIVYNRAALLLNNFRLQEFIHFGDSIDIGLVSMAVQSSTTFQFMTQNRSLAELPLMSEARLAMLRGDFHSALKIIGGIRSSEQRARVAAKNPLLDVEYVYCLARCGESVNARIILEKVDLSRYIELDNDDRIIFFSQLMNIADQIGCAFPIEELSRLFRTAIAEFSDELTGLQDAVASIKFGDDKLDECKSVPGLQTIVGV
jgi:hypothetical protein